MEIPWSISTMWNPGRNHLSILLIEFKFSATLGYVVKHIQPAYISRQMPTTRANSFTLLRDIIYLLILFVCFMQCWLDHSLSFLRFFTIYVKGFSCFFFTFLWIVFPVDKGNQQSSFQLSSNHMQFTKS